MQHKSYTPLLVMVIKTSVRAMYARLCMHVSCFFHVILTPARPWPVFLSFPPRIVSLARPNTSYTERRTHAHTHDPQPLSLLYTINKPASADRVYACKLKKQIPIPIVLARLPCMGCTRVHLTDTPTHMHTTTHLYLLFVVVQLPHPRLHSRQLHINLCLVTEQIKVDWQLL